MRLGKHRALGCLIALFTVTANAAFAEQTVVLGQIKLSFYAVTGAVIQRVLERLGHTVEVREGPHEEIFPMLGRGEVDLLAAAWLPEAHATYWTRYKDQALELATLYEGAHLFWGVPAYVPEAAVKSVEDLVKPEVVAKMTKTIQGIGPGSGLMIASRKMMVEYGLEKAGYKLLTGTGQDMATAAARAIAEQRWVVIPLWTPQYLNKAYPIRPLLEPKGLLGGMNKGVLVAHKDFPGKVPPRTVETLRRIHLGLEAVAEMDYLVNVEKKTPLEAARAWMDKNPAIVESWIAGK